MVALGVRGGLTSHGPQQPLEAYKVRHKAIQDGMRELTRTRPRYRWTASVEPNFSAPSVPPGWLPSQLADTGLYINGIAFKPTDWGHSGRPIIRIQNLSGGSRDYNYTNREVRPDNVIAGGDMLVSWSATLDTFMWEGPEGVLNQHIFKVVPNAAAVRQRFLYWLLKHEIRELAESKHAHGLAMMHINRGPFLSHSVFLPPLDEQDRIIAKVDQLIALCDELEAAQAMREEQRDLLRIASLSRLTASPYSRDVARSHVSHLHRMIARPEHVTELRQTILDLAFGGRLMSNAVMPSAPISLREVATLQNGYAFKSEWFGKTGTRLLRNANIGHGDLRWDDVVYLPPSRTAEFERFELIEGDIVLSLDRPFIRTGTKVAQVSASDLPCLLLQRVGRFIFDRGMLDATYLYLWVCSPHFARQIDPGRSNGVPHVSSREVESAVVHVPPLPEQRRIVAKVEQLMAVCDELEKRLTAVQTGRARFLDAVLHEALTEGGVDSERALAGAH